MYFDDGVLETWLKGDRDAVEFIGIISDIAHVWDDLIDRDHPVDDETIDRVFSNMLIDLPRNAFYVKHFDRLHAILTTAIANWQAANKMEREGDDYERSIAFILRSSYVDLVTQSAYLLGGAAWARQVAEEIRLMTHRETYGGYLEALDRERARREKGGAARSALPEGAVLVAPREKKHPVKPS
ncbi:hypothetical protein [Modicisalibacter coralii]|uniref:hypothetical protein n=1 Tax=Modicisalibacter coralii TaxID=2304602 RepID=UPI00193AA556|nr:hypothetical protein [Halomonas coralii]